MGLPRCEYGSTGGAVVILYRGDFGGVTRTKPFASLAAKRRAVKDLGLGTPPIGVACSAVRRTRYIPPDRPGSEVWCAFCRPVRRENTQRRGAEACSQPLLTERLAPKTPPTGHAPYAAEIGGRTRKAAP